MNDRHKLSRREALILPLAGGFGLSVDLAAAQQAQSNAAILVAYFSRTGNTRVIARQIRRAHRADIFEINPAEPYPEDYQEIVQQAERERRSGYEPPLTAAVPNIETYAAVFLGLPCAAQHSRHTAPVSSSQSHFGSTPNVKRRPASCGLSSRNGLSPRWSAAHPTFGGNWDRPSRLPEPSTPLGSDRRYSRRSYCVRRSADATGQNWRTNGPTVASAACPAASRAFHKGQMLISLSRDCCRGKGTEQCAAHSRLVPIAEAEDLVICTRIKLRPTSVIRGIPLIGRA